MLFGCYIYDNIIVNQKWENLNESGDFFRVSITKMKHVPTYLITKIR